MKQLVLVNRSLANANISLYVVPSGGTASDDNILISNLTLEPSTTIPISFACFTLNAGDTVQGIQNITGAITIHAHGVEV